jgi:hypothetical protein
LQKVDKGWPAKYGKYTTDFPSTDLKMTAYSYKPATGLEGASTVVPLKNGCFLEVRRGSKTRWTDGEERNMWVSLDAWKETLPEGAIIVEKSHRWDNPIWSDDFKAARDLVKRMTGMNPTKYPLYTEKRETAISSLELKVAECNQCAEMV